MLRVPSFIEHQAKQWSRSTPKTSIWDPLVPNLAKLSTSGCKNQTCAVGSYHPNRLGLYDMHGNVWECCQDEKGISMRIYIGDGWESDSWNGKASFGRTPIPPSARHTAVGLRLVRVPAGAP